MQELPYSFSADVFSLGCLAFQLLAGTSPFDDQPHLSGFKESVPEIKRYLERINDFPNFLKKKPFVSPQAADFIKQCIVADPFHRATLFRLQKHTFLKDCHKFGPSLRESEPKNRKPSLSRSLTFAPFHRKILSNSSIKFKKASTNDNLKTNDKRLSRSRQRQLKNSQMQANSVFLVSNGVHKFDPWAMPSVHASTMAKTTKTGVSPFSFTSATKDGPNHAPATHLTQTSIRRNSTIIRKSLRLTPYPNNHRDPFADPSESGQAKPGDQV